MGGYIFIPPVKVRVGVRLMASSTHDGHRANGSQWQVSMLGVPVYLEGHKLAKARGAQGLRGQGGGVVAGVRVWIWVRGRVRVGVWIWVRFRVTVRVSQRLNKICEGRE